MYCYSQLGTYIQYLCVYVTAHMYVFSRAKKMCGFSVHWVLGFPGCIAFPYWQLYSHSFLLIALQGSCVRLLGHYCKRRDIVAHCSPWIPTQYHLCREWTEPRPALRLVVFLLWLVVRKILFSVFSLCFFILHIGQFCHLGPACGLALKPSLTRYLMPRVFSWSRRCYGWDYRRSC